MLSPYTPWLILTTPSTVQDHDFRLSWRFTSLARAKPIKFRQHDDAVLIMSDFNAERNLALADLKAWVQSGRLKVIEDVGVGLETLPAALVGLLAGENRGKRMVRVQ